MRIERHWIQPDPARDPFIFRRDNGKLRLRNFITPDAIVIHYAVTDSIEATVAAQRDRGYWAHLSIDGGFVGAERSVAPSVVQAVAFNERGSHALGHNEHTIGIEIANPGPLLGEPGALKTVWGADYDGPFFAGRHKFKGAPAPWKHWASYSPEELEILRVVCRGLVEAYPTIREIVGHDDLSPGRKFDPGPAFPLENLRKAVFG